MLPHARASILGLSLCFLAPVAAAQTPPDYGQQFVTITRPSNRPMLGSERVLGAGLVGRPNLGRVDYSYRVARTEVTVSQWKEFIDVYWPFWEAQGGNRLDSAFTSNYIVPLSFAPGTPPQFTIISNGANRAATMTWRLAATYCNWLHNGKPTANTGGGPLSITPFQTGAYDIRTFTTNPDLTVNDQPVPSPGAKYWIPSLDEWTKATYYDPNRYGPGQEGYWKYPYRSDSEPIGGPPGVGQTSAGSFAGPDPDVGSYPGSTTPWGLLDTSGTRSEWTGTTESFFNQYGYVSFSDRYVRGSTTGGDTFPDASDYLLSSQAAWAGGYSLRLASVVPAPSTAVVLLLQAMSVSVWTRTRRRVRQSPGAVACLA